MEHGGSANISLTKVPKGREERGWGRGRINLRVHHGQNFQKNPFRLKESDHRDKYECVDKSQHKLYKNSNDYKVVYTC